LPCPLAYPRHTSRTGYIWQSFQHRNAPPRRSLEPLFDYSPVFRLAPLSPSFRSHAVLVVFVFYKVLIRADLLALIFLSLFSLRWFCGGRPIPFFFGYDVRPFVIYHRFEPLAFCGTVHFFFLSPLSGTKLFPEANEVGSLPPLALQPFPRLKVFYGYSIFHCLHPRVLQISTPDVNVHLIFKA